MQNNRLKDEYLAMEVPDLQEKILAGVQAKTVHPRRKLRPVAVVAVAVLVAVLGLTAGAAADSLLNIKSGGKYLLRDENGVVFSPTGFHLEEDVNAPLSEKALENIEPYITHFSADTENREFMDYETSELADMETLIDMPLFLPKTIIDQAVLYRFTAAEAEGEIRSMHIIVLTEDEQHAGDMLVHMVHLVGFPGVVGTSSEPVFEQSVLSDGTPVSIVISESRKGGLVANVLYKIDGAVYHLEVYGDKKKALLNEVEAILDTVR